MAGDSADKAAALQALEVAQRSGAAAEKLFKALVQKLNESGIQSPVHYAVVPTMPEQEEDNEWLIDHHSPEQLSVAQLTNRLQQQSDRTSQVCLTVTLPALTVSLILPIFC